jgi:hypothetical protein
MIEQVYTYSELRSTIITVKAFIKNNYWGKNLSLKTRIDRDLGITGDDAWELIEKFGKDLSIDLSLLQRHFLEYFNSEGDMIGTAWIDLIITSVKWLIFFILYPFSKAKVLQLKEYSYFHTHFKKDKELTIKDLVVSLLNKQFMPANNVKIKIT